MCTDSDDWRLTAYALGELDGADAAEVERLLARDESARQAVEEIRRAADMLSNSMQDTGTEELTHTQREAILSVAPAGARRAVRVWVPLAAAAVAALAVAVGWWMLAGRGAGADKGGSDVAEQQKKHKAPGLETTPGQGRRRYEATPGSGRKGTSHAPSGAKTWPPASLPAGVGNAALRKPVTSSDTNPPGGNLSMVTDGELADGKHLVLGPGRQWVQIDLGSRHEIFAVRLWHHRGDRAYRDVVVQVCDEAGFETSVHTLFNNDRDNSASLGLGSDEEYIENHRGLVIDARGMRGRYVRLYSSGNTADEQNHYAEVEVYARGVEDGE